MICKVCGKELSFGNKSGLCHTCLRSKEDNEKIQLWLSTGNTGCAVGTTLRNCIRKYILDSQSCKCAICGIENNWNGMCLNFVLDHIDGNAANNSRENLRLICPNCDSQLPTYKSRNRNSARNYRKLYNVLYNKPQSVENGGLPER